jgi:hypothetical protein
VTGILSRAPPLAKDVGRLAVSRDPGRS